MRLKWWLASLAILAIVVIAGLHVLSGVVRAEVQRKISAEYGKGFQAGRIDVRLFPRIVISGEKVVYRPDNRSDVPPLIQIRRFSAETNWIVVLGEHVRRLTLEGLVITVPPRREGAAPKPAANTKARGVVIDRIVANGAMLLILPKKAGKEPLEFDLHDLTLNSASEEQAMSFTTVLKNAKPPGEIHSSGKFGPWQSGDPARTPVEGEYTFDHADLAVFKGIAGILSSRGNYQGTLDHIEVSGTTDVPDFRLRISGQPVHLATNFHSIVDGMNGDTTLDPVNGMLGETRIVARGEVANQGGEKGKTVRLDGKVQNGNLADVLRLAVPGEPSMSGAISFESSIVIPPGDVDVAEKLQLDGHFTIAQAEFSKLNVQDKVNELSHRGSGNPKAPEDQNVASNFRGRFKLNGGVITFSDLNFAVPGADISLAGTYGLEDRKIDMRGHAILRAKLSQTTTGIKSFLLKALNPLFETNKAGASIPIHIAGTSKSPSFGLGEKGF